MLGWDHFESGALRATRLVGNIIVATCIHCGASAAPAVDEGAAIEITYPTHAVIGMPVPLEMTVHGERTLVPPGLTRVGNPFAIELKAADRSYGLERVVSCVIKRPPYQVHAIGEMTAPLSKDRVEHGVTTRYVLDLTSISCFEVMKDGRSVQRRHDMLEPDLYTLGMGMVGEDLVVGYPTYAMTLSPPNQEERRLLERVYGSSKDNLVWRWFVKHAMDLRRGIDLSQFSETARRQLQYHLLLGQLVDSPVPIAELEIKPEDVRGMWSVYESDVCILEYELDLARKDDQGAAKNRERILGVRPTAEKFLDEIERSGGVIAQFRAEIEREKAAEVPPKEQPPPQVEHP